MHSAWECAWKLNLLFLEMIVSTFIFWFCQINFNCLTKTEFSNPTIMIGTTVFWVEYFIHVIFSYFINSIVKQWFWCRIIFVEVKRTGIFLKIKHESLTEGIDDNIFRWWEIAMGAMNKTFPINLVGVIFFYNKDNWEKTSIDPQEIPYNQVQ